LPFRCKARSISPDSTDNLCSRFNLQQTCLQSENKMPGEVLLAAASEGKRSEQVNVRLIIEEKAIPGASATARGFGSPVDFFRAKTLSSES